LISGIRLQQLGLANFRRLLGTVMQDDQLFAGSIADNIAFLILHRICSGYKCVR
jgi:ATP-binding cassette subfamily B protein RaxB